MVAEVAGGGAKVVADVVARGANVVAGGTDVVTSGVDVAGGSSAVIVGCRRCCCRCAVCCFGCPLRRTPVTCRAAVVGVDEAMAECCCFQFCHCQRCRW